MLPFFSISGSDFVEMFVGVGASQGLETCLSKVKKMLHVLFLLMRLMQLVDSRGAGLGGGNDEREQTLKSIA